MKNKIGKDLEFTKLLANHMMNAKGWLDYGVERGLTSPQDLRLTVAKRVETVKALKDTGMSQRKIAKTVGVSPKQVRRDLGGAKGPKNGAKGPTAKPKKSANLVPEGPDDGDEVVWRRGLLYRANEAVAGAAYEQSWAKTFKIDSEIMDAVMKAAKAWNELAAFVKKHYE
jgi:hypothetical protein